MHFSAVLVHDTFGRATSMSIRLNRVSFVRYVLFHKSDDRFLRRDERRFTRFSPVNCLSSVFI